MKHLERIDVLIPARFKVHLGGKRYVKFDTLEAAKRACEDVFQKTGIVLAIELVQP